VMATEQSETIARCQLDFLRFDTTYSSLVKRIERITMLPQDRNGASVFRISTKANA
jgi:hypothetical protein